MPTPMIQISSGPVVGRSSAAVRSWRGVPYGRADRFAPAQPHPGWTEPLDATSPGPVAVQVDAGRLVGTEACLTLDVYVPEDAAAPLPVLFWVHGGGFLTGATADYDGAALAAAGPAVVVAVGYRLGVLGFLQLGSADEPTPSWALTDLCLALDWVHREISAFGGNPEDITLAGQSAGAMLTTALITTEAGRQARRALAFSVGDPVLDIEDAIGAADRLLAELGLTRADTRALAEVPVEQLVDATGRVQRAARRERPAGIVFQPVVDGSVLPRSPLDAVLAGRLRDTGLWLGSCRDEMTMFLQSGREDAAAGARRRLGKAAWSRLLEVYAATATPGEDVVQALLTDAMWVRPLVALAEAQVSAGGRVWVSRFDATPSLPPFPELGPTHGADDACLWAQVPLFVERPLRGRTGGPMDAADVAVTVQLQAAVLAFVRTGAPAAPALAGWRPYDLNLRPTAVFDTDCRVEEDPAPVRRRAWAKLNVGTR